MLNKWLLIKAAPNFILIKLYIILVMKNKVAWAIAIGSSIPQGIVIAWTAMMVVNLTQV